jgi:predicted amidophosphoribosyltransferase
MSETPMRDRHIPRLCRSCAAPMARQRDDCWRCGVEWASAEPSRPKLRLVPAVPIAAEVEARVSARRRGDDGGSYAEPPARRVVGVARR